MVEATPVETLQNQFSGYGSTSTIVARVLDILKPATPLDKWDDETVQSVVSTFVDVKFPTVIALNKIDHPDSHKNMEKITGEYPDATIVPTSAKAEVLLRKLAKQKYVKYDEGSEFLDTYDDLVEMGEPDGGGLRPLEGKLKDDVENIRDMVLFRYFGTGVASVLTEAARMLGLIPVFPVANVSILNSSAEVPTGNKAAAFRDCVLVKKWVVLFSSN